MIYRRTAHIISCSIAALAATPSYAQLSEAAPAPAQGDTSGPGDIVVTAQRRTERLNDVPISITVVGGEAISESRITRASQLVQLVPNLQTNGAIGDSQPIYSIRGVSMNDYSLNQNAPIATYYDEVYKGNVGILGIIYYDLERVEVLRGPQGTLYGKNATGGAVNLITRAPEFKTEGYLTLTGGNYARHEAQGAIQLSLSDTVAARFAFTFARADGWYKNLLPGKADMQQTRQWAARASILFEPSDSFSMILRASTSYENPIHDAIYSEAGANGIGAGVYGMFNALDPVLNPLTDYFRPAGMARRSTESNNVIRRNNRTYAASLTAKYDLSDTLALTSITSYDRGSFYFEEDADGSPLKVFEESFYDKAKQFTQDLRIASSGEGPFQFLLGAYYFDESVFNISTIPLFQDIDANLDGVLDNNDCLDAFPIGCDIRNQLNQKKTSIAVYSDASFALSDRVKLRGGLRYTHDKARLSDFMSQAFGTDGVLILNLIPGSTTDLFATTSRRFSKNNVSGKIGIDFKPVEDTLLYLTYSRGYRGGSFNGQAYFVEEELSTTKSEMVTAYEFGVKTTLFDRALQLNASTFYYAYKNQQFIDVDPSTGAQPLVNLPKSRILGAEVELTARPVHGLVITGGAGFLDSEVKEGSLGGIDIRGNSIVNAPAFTATAAMDWDIVEADWGRLALRLDGNYSAKRYFDLQNRASTTQKPYAIANARLGWRSTNDRFGLDLWVRNITNTFYANDKIDVRSGFGFIYNRIGEPRTYGVTFDASF